MGSFTTMSETMMTILIWNSREAVSTSLRMALRPACLIGQGLAKQGFTFEMMDRLGWNQASFSFLAAFLSNNGAEISSKDANWINAVQACQDRHMTWGQSVHYADTQKGIFRG